ncbi:Ff.00g016300.m01.CDS01 [Fusarium sp. VM40]|nr:Ff.00g016300.m01.CDS01 [Fusarium sp. VM40]
MESPTVPAPVSVAVPASPVEEKQEYFPITTSAGEAHDPLECRGTKPRCACTGCTGCTGKIYCISSQQCYECYSNCLV